MAAACAASKPKKAHESEKRALSLTCTSRPKTKELERDLDPHIFCRIHRSSIVNLRRVAKLSVDAAGDHEVILDSGQKLRLSRRFRKAVQDRMREFSAVH